MTQTARRLVDIGEVARMLNARIQDLARELLPAGRREGHEWVVGSPAGEPGTQMAIHLSGAKAGVWKHFAGTEGGDGLDLVAAVLFAGDKGHALAWSLRYLGLESGDPRALETARRALPDLEKQKAQTEAEIEETRNAAHRIWLGAEPRIADTPVDRYLKGRGIDLNELGRQPGAIRYHPALYHKPSGRKWPAMVTAMSGPVPRGFMGCHRTWLEVQQDGRVTKAPVEDNKRTYGSYVGGHISLWRGASGKPLKQAPPGEILDITEGIEDGLTVATTMPECRVIAAISLSNYTLVLPEQISVVRIWKQNDTKLPAIKAFDRFYQAQITAGRKVMIVKVPPEYKDVNDWLRAER